MRNAGCCAPAARNAAATGAPAASRWGSAATNPRTATNETRQVVLEQRPRDACVGGSGGGLFRRPACPDQRRSLPGLAARLPASDPVDLLNVTVAIAHHPARADLLEPLLVKLGGQVEVVVDPRPKRLDAWANAKRAWKLGRKLGGTHHLVMEDDVTVCRDFLAAVQEGIERWPNEMVRWYAIRGVGDCTGPFRAARAAGE